MTAKKAEQQREREISWLKGTFHRYNRYEDTNNLHIDKDLQNYDQICVSFGSTALMRNINVKVFKPTNQQDISFEQTSSFQLFPW